jgi:hypothetical protein
MIGQLVHWFQSRNWENKNHDDRAASVFFATFLYWNCFDSVVFCVLQLYGIVRGRNVPSAHETINVIFS